MMRTLVFKTAAALADVVSGVFHRHAWVAPGLRWAAERVFRHANIPWIPWRINGIPFRVDPLHRPGRRRDATVAAHLSSRVKSGDLTINAGANVGAYALQMAHWSRPNGRVIAIEPNPQACAVLRKHVELNGLHDRVDIVQMALGKMAGHATLYASGADGMSRLRSPYPHLVATARAVTVPVVRLDDLCQARGLQPDWIVMDVEGYEIHALAGARGVITALAPRLGLVVEMHPTVWSAHGVSRTRAEKLLQGLGLRAIGMSGQQDPLGEQGVVLLQYTEHH